MFRHVGEYWDLAYDSGELFRVKHVKGLGDMARLLRNPGREISAAELMGLATGGSSMGATRADGLVIDDGGGLPRGDADTRDAIEDALEDIREKIGAATGRGDIDAVTELRDQETKVVQFRSEVVDKRGRSRSSGSTRGNARTAVSNRIATAIHAIQLHDTAMATHLDNSIRRGLTVVYEPEKRLPWEF